MSPALNGSSTLERFERSNASEIRNGIMFDFYPGLPHMYLVFCYNNHLQHTTVAFPPSIFLIGCNMQNRGETPCPFYDVTDISVYLGRYKGGGVPHRRTRLRSFLVVSVPSTGDSNICKAKNIPLQIQNEQHTLIKCVLLIGDPSLLCT